MLRSKTLCQIYIQVYNNREIIGLQGKKNTTIKVLADKNNIEDYESPLVIVRDMAKGIKLSVDKNFPNAAQQVCQIHFLSDREKDLITEYHKKLKSSIAKHKLTSKLKYFHYENNELDSVLISSLQSILEGEGCYEII